MDWQEFHTAMDVPHYTTTRRYIYRFCTLYVCYRHSQRQPMIVAGHRDAAYNNCIMKSFHIETYKYILRCNWRARKPDDRHMTNYIIRSAEHLWRADSIELFGYTVKVLLACAARLCTTMCVCMCICIVWLSLPIASIRSMSNVLFMAESIVHCRYGRWLSKMQCMKKFASISEPD